MKFIKHFKISLKIRHKYLGITTTA